MRKMRFTQVNLSFRKLFVFDIEEFLPRMFTPLAQLAYSSSRLPHRPM